MNKIKKLTALLLTLVMMIAFTSISAFAEENSTTIAPEFLGKYDFDENNYHYLPAIYFDESNSNGLNNGYNFENLDMEIFPNYIKLLITANGKTFDFSGEIKITGYNSGNYTLSLEKYNGTIYLNHTWDGRVESGVYLMDGYKAEYGNGPYYFKFFNYKNISTEPQTLETSFMQKVTTDSGQYEMYISGFLNATVVNGENVLTADDIKNQSISIHVKNTQTGETRVMTQSTIEGLTLNVSGGKVTSVTLNGRVQTSKGTLERYTTTVNV